uniref:Lipase_3 domain-containing protein n=1 Tax=Parastrongyloides trichosuri TaxID=131310 RepID=A0A0N4ZV44_PARTI
MESFYKKKVSISFENPSNIEDCEFDVLDEKDIIVKSSSVLIKSINNNIEFTALRHKHPKSTFLKYIEKNVSENLDILDDKSETKMLSTIGRFISLLAATGISYNNLTIMTLSIIYGKDFVVACFLIGLLFLVPIMFPIMYMEILIGQLTPVNISSFFFKNSPNLENAKNSFFINVFYKCNMKRPDIDTKIYNTDDGKKYIGQKLGYFCLYTPTVMDQYQECKAFHDNFSNKYYRRDLNSLDKIFRFIEKSQYTFSKYGYSFTTRIVTFFYFSYVISLFYLTYSLSFNNYYFNGLSVLINKHVVITEIKLNVWFLSFIHMAHYLKSGHGIIIKIASKFPKGTNSTNMAFFVYLFNFLILFMNISLTFLLYKFDTERGFNNEEYLSLLSSKLTIRAHISSGLYQYFDSCGTSGRTFVGLLLLGLFGLSTYQSFIYIDLLDFEHYNISIQHAKYVTKRFKTSATITFLFLLIPMFPMFYSEVGKIFFLVEEVFNTTISFLMFQIIIITFGIGIKKFTIFFKTGHISQLINLFIRMLIKYVITPLLVFLLIFKAILRDYKDVHWEYFAKEMYDYFLVDILTYSFNALLFFCLVFWPFFELLNTVFNGKSSTNTFICDLSNIN